MNALRTSLLAALAAGLGCTGVDGTAGAPGPAGPSMPVIQSLSATGLPAAPGATLTVHVVAASGEGLSLAYAWSVSAGWDVQGGGSTDTVTVAAPAGHGATGSATITVTDGKGRIATGMAALSTAGNGAPVISAIAAAPAIMTRDVPGTITVWAADPDGEPLDYSWQLPVGFTIVSGQGTSRLAVKAPSFASGFAEVAVSDGTAITTAGVYLSTGEGAWGASEIIGTEAPLSGGAYRPQVALDRSGNAIAVWYNFGGRAGTDDIWANRYRAGTGWGAAALIETDDGFTGYPQVAVDDAGNAIAIWEQFDGIRSNIRTNRYVPGTGWATAALIETEDLGSAGDPQIAIEGSGSATAVWVQSNGVRSSIRANRYVPGTGWGTAALLESPEADGAAAPQVAVDGSGNAIAVWRRADGVRDDIWANVYLAGTGWSGADLIESEDAGPAESPQLGIDGSNAIAVWAQSDGAATTIRARLYFAGSGWGVAGLVSEKGADAHDPQVAVDDGGNAIAVWHQLDGVRSDVWANRYVAGTGWSGAALIEHEDSESADAPQVAIDAGGNAIVVWRHGSAASISGRIWANRYVARTGWVGAAPLDPDLGGDAYRPQVSMDRSGDAIAVWDQGSVGPGGWNIWANRFR